LKGTVFFFVGGFVSAYYPQMRLLPYNLSRQHGFIG
jgi:hypothetical protein